MVYEFRCYTFSIENWKSYLKLFNDVCMPIRQNDFGVLKGHWVYEDNDSVKFYHLWEYSSLDGRQQLRESLGKVNDWQEKFIKYAPSLIDEQSIQILYPVNPEHDFHFAEDLSLIEIKCTVGKLKSVISDITNHISQDTQINIVEFPNPNVLVLFSKSKNGIGIAEHEGIKSVTCRQLLGL